MKRGWIIAVCLAVIVACNSMNQEGDNEVSTTDMPTIAAPDSTPQPGLQIEGHVTRQDGSRLTVEKNSVSTVEGAEKVADRNLNGTLIGTFSGFGIAFGFCAAANAKLTASGPIWDGEGVALYTSCGLLGAGVGSMAGYFLDRAHKVPEVFYRAPR